MILADSGVAQGVLFGLLAAIFQSLSYLCLRIFIARHNNDIVRLLAMSHILMGIVSIPLAILLLPEAMPAFSTYALVLLATSGFYLLGQFFLFAAMIRFEPSLVSPLLGMKILILAVLSVTFFHQQFSPAKWMAVILCTASVFLLSNSGKRFEWKCIAMVLSACLFYSLSDMGIQSLVGKFSYMGLLHGASLSSAFCYILCGIFGGIILGFTPKGASKGMWIYAVPFAVTWFSAMIFLFSCFGVIGVVFGNIIQSARGLISIVLGVFVAYAGFVALEPKISRRILFQRILAAILMTGSVALFLT